MKVTDTQLIEMITDALIDANPYQLAEIANTLLYTTKGECANYVGLENNQDTFIVPEVL